MARPGRPDAIGTHRRIEVFEVAITEVFTGGVEAGGELVAHVGTDHRFTRPGQRYQPRRQVDAGAINIDAIRPCFGDIQPGAHHDAFFFRAAAIVDREQLMNFARSGNRVAHRIKANQQAVAQALDQLATMARQHDIAHLMHRT